MFQTHGTASLRNTVLYYKRISQGDYNQIAMDNVRLVKLAASNSPLGRSAMIYAMAASSYASPERLKEIKTDNPDALISNVLNFPFIDKGNAQSDEFELFTGLISKTKNLKYTFTNV